MENVVPIPTEFNWPEVAEVLLEREHAWPLATAEWHQIELTPSIVILWLFMCHNIKPTSHRTTFPDQIVGFIYHLVRDCKIDLATLIYNQIQTLVTWRDRRTTLVFPSLISDICRAAGVTILPEEVPEKPSLLIKRTTFGAQERARIRHREEQDRERKGQQQAAQGQGPDDAEMPQAPPPQ